MAKVIVRLTCHHPAGARFAGRLRRRAAGYLSALGRDDAELSLVLTTDGRIRGLNRRWRGKDRTTDVLSFPISEPPGSGSLLGDVVISLDTAERRSRAGRRRLGAELERYLVHGILHLLGFDHERSGEARKMALLEAQLAEQMGLVGAALMQEKRGRGRRAVRGEERWTPWPTSILTPSRSGSTAPGTRATRSRAASRR